jgi:hypothetical protein
MLYAMSANLLIRSFFMRIWKLALASGISPNESGRMFPSSKPSNDFIDRSAVSQLP